MSQLSEQYDVPTGVAKKFHSGVSSRVFKAALAEMVRCMRTGALPVEMGGYEHEEPTFASEEEEMAVEQPGKKQKRDRRRPPKPVQVRSAAAASIASSGACKRCCLLAVV
jgi:hypothetical protein